MILTERPTVFSFSVYKRITQHDCNNARDQTNRQIRMLVYGFVVDVSFSLAQLNGED